MSKDKDYIESLHQNSKPPVSENAPELRRSETDAEKKLWQLKGKKFRRQHAIDNYVLDFYCHECRLAIELDGGIHDLQENKEYDEARTSVLNEYKITVIRFRNAEVMNDAEKVLEKTAAYLKS